MDFVRLWHLPATTTLRLFWMAFWAFGLGYLISSMIQVFIESSFGCVWPMIPSSTRRFPELDFRGPGY